MMPRSDVAYWLTRDLGKISLVRVKPVCPRDGGPVWGQGVSSRDLDGASLDPRGGEGEGVGVHRGGVSAVRGHLLRVRV